MNERIKALAEEAVNAVQSRPNGICDMNKYNQKFAELIVKECLAQVDKVDAMLDDNKEKTGVAWVGLAIARHFGVEE
jgi:hypothetical protein